MRPHMLMPSRCLFMMKTAGAAAAAVVESLLSQGTSQRQDTETTQAQVKTGRFTPCWAPAGFAAVTLTSVYLRWSPWRPRPLRLRETGIHSPMTTRQWRLIGFVALFR